MDFGFYYAKFADMQLQRINMSKQKYEISDAELATRFVRDEKLMKADLFNISPLMDKREAYSQELKNNLGHSLEVVAVQTEDRLNEQKEKNEKKQHAKSNFVYGLIVMAFLAAGINVCDEFVGDIEHPKSQKIEKFDKMPTHPRTAVIITICLIMGIVCGFVLSGTVENKKWTKKNADEFYKRLIVRYFDVAQANNPEITENGIATFNPEMSKLIYGLLAMNLSKRDMAKLDNLALTIESQFDTQTNDFGDNLRRIDNAMHQATQIVEKALKKTPELQRVINDAYMGQIPMSLVVAKGKKQNSGR